MVQYSHLLFANSSASSHHRGNSSSSIASSKLNLPIYSSSPIIIVITTGSSLLTSTFIRIFCDVLLVLSSFVQVLFLETRLWVKMINSLRPKSPMAELKLTTWKRSRRKGQPSSSSSSQTFSTNKNSNNTSCIDISGSSTVIRNKFSFARALQFVLYLLIVDKFHLLSGAPLPRTFVSSSSVQHYLLKFGYLPQSGFEIRNQVTEERMREAIRELQSFANLTVTGEVDAATAKLIKTPRCGVPDILTGQFNSRTRHRRFIIQGQKWPNTSLTWSLKRPTPTHDEREITEELRRAFDVWSRNTLLRFKLLNRDRADEADIRIVFSKGYHDDGYPFDGKGSILAHAFFPGTGQGGDAHFDDDEVWVIGGKSHNGEGTRLFAVAAHEFGHSLGLSHSDVEGSLMYPWYQNFDYDLQLSQDDKLGIERIYGSNSRFSPNPYNPHKGGGGDRRGFNNIPTPAPPVHTTRRPIYRGKNYYPDGRPSTCDSSYDAISLIRDELFIFRGRYFWRINSTPNDNRLLKGYPSLITMMWQELPANLTHVDAVYEHNEVEIIFFIGNQYWRFAGTKLIEGYPKPLKSMGISPDVEKIDGAMIWGYNKKTYLFSGTKYWRLQDDSRYFQVEPDYPRDMHIWDGVPYNIDSVLRWKDGNVYFFKGKVFWKFDDKHMRVESRTPTLSAPFWMGCTSTPIIPTENPTTHAPTASSAGSVSPNRLYFSMLSILSLSLIVDNLYTLRTTMMMLLRANYRLPIYHWSRFIFPHLPVLL